jgi:hypothetical protein
MLFGWVRCIRRIHNLYKIQAGSRPDSYAQQLLYALLSFESSYTTRTIKTIFRLGLRCIAASAYAFVSHCQSNWAVSRMVIKPIAKQVQTSLFFFFYITRLEGVSHPLPKLSNDLFDSLFLDHSLYSPFASSSRSLSRWIIG